MWTVDLGIEPIEITHPGESDRALSLMVVFLLEIKRINKLPFFQPWKETKTEQKEEQIVSFEDLKEMERHSKKPIEVHFWSSFIRQNLIIFQY